MTNYNDLTNKQLIKIVENLERQKKYGLVYKKHKEDIIEKCASHIPVFEEIRNRAVVGGGGVNHILIEGDNYPSLLTLQGAYKNKINVIYIDPPYNTGNKDFIYNDDLVDKEDMYRHSKWLSFMEPRLELARELLSDDGVIFISIDDNEQAQLKLLCDEVFGESNSVGLFTVETPNKTEDKNKLKNNDYLFVYSKNNNFLFRHEQKIQSGRCTTGKENQTQPELKFLAGTRVEGIKSGKYSCPRKTGGKEDIILIDGQLEVNDGKLLNDVIMKARWSCPNDIKRFYGKMKKKDGGPIYNKFGKEIIDLYLKGDRFQPQLIKKGSKIPQTILLGLTKKGSECLREIVNKCDFPYPKHPQLIKEIISWTNKNSIILDFFAGSGTTFQAVAELNKEDGGQRKCVLITNNENKICENITYQRCKKVIEGYTTPKGKIIEGTKQNLRYFRTNFVEAGQDQAQIRANLKANIAPMICMENDGYNLLKKDIGYEVYTNDDLTIAILISNTPKYIKSLKNILKDIKGPIKVYQALSTGGVEIDLKQQLQNKNIEVYSSVDDYVKIYQHSTYKLRLEQNDE